MEAKKISFARVEIRDLERLGWTFDSWDDNTALAMYVSEEEAIEINRKYFHAIIKVDANGRTFYDWEDTETGDRTDWSETGDDEKTIEDLATLLAQGKLWDVEYDG